MSEVMTAARTAREQLSSALAALQSPEAGNLIDTVAEPVAAAMSALHQIEASGGAALPVCGPQALAAVRRALEALQLVPPDHPVVEAATASVAGSLGLVFQIAQDAMQAAPPVAPAPVAAPPVGAPPVHAPASSSPAPWSESAGPPSSSRATDPLAQTYMAPHDLAVTARESPRPRQSNPALARPSDPQGSVVAAPSSTSVPAPQRPPDAVAVEAALGAHSPTNFYKGLTGNDVIDDGGIFIATYQIPRIGQDLWIRVSLPGGYEFEASGQVAWTRESGSGDAPPGFGARFREISSEARQLVYRYVRNREPLFHDDF